MAELVNGEGKGFSFDLATRNNLLLKKGIKLPELRKTGTTLAALIFKVLNTVLINICIYNCIGWSHLGSRLQGYIREHNI